MTHIPDDTNSASRQQQQQRRTIVTSKINGQQVSGDYYSKKAAFENAKQFIIENSLQKDLPFQNRTLNQIGVGSEIKTTKKPPLPAQYKTISMNEEMSNTKEGLRVHFAQEGKNIELHNEGNDSLNDIQISLTPNVLTKKLKAKNRVSQMQSSPNKSH